MDVYGAILDGINTKKANTITIENYLESLKPHVRFLRRAYFARPVAVPYDKTDIQDSYLIAYFPHYYQLLYNILLEEIPDFFKNKKTISVSFIGGGPGSEIYGLIQYIANNAKHIKQVNIQLFDINADTWKHSHEIIDHGLFKKILPLETKLKWHSYQLDITNNKDVSKFRKHFVDSDLVVVQNCLNEIPPRLIDQTENNIIQIFEWLSPKALLLLSDMTSGARDVLKAIEKLIVGKFNPSFHKTTLKNVSSGSLISSNHIPSQQIKKHLLTGEDGLIPRKYIKYDFTIIGKKYDGKEFQSEALGFNALYRPLSFNYLDVNDRLAKNVFVGIDFGTSTTAVCAAYLHGGKLEIEPLAIPQKGKDGSLKLERLIPGVISKVGNSLMVGYYAALYKPTLTSGKDCWHSFKKNLSALEDVIYPESCLKDHPKKRINNMKDALRVFLEYLHREVSSIISDRFPGKEPLYALSVPVGFGTREKMQLKLMMNEAGFKCEDVPFVEEPNAAMIHYFFASNTNIETGHPFKSLIIDVGAGTVDFSIVEVEKNGTEIMSRLLAVHRDGQQGGDWIDLKIADQILLKNKILKDIPEEKRRPLLAYCEQLKIMLCKGLFTDKSVSFLLDEIAHSDYTVSLPHPFVIDESRKILVGITYHAFKEIMQEYWSGGLGVTGIIASVTECLNIASLSADTIDKVIVTGGGARNPYMKSYLAGYFGGHKLFLVDDIQEQVARGTALHSFVINSFGKAIITSLLNENHYVDIDGTRQTIFKKNDSYPTHDKDVFFKNVRLKSLKINLYKSEKFIFTKAFLIPDPSKVDQLVFFIDPDQELRCEVLTGKESFPAKEVFT